MALQENHDYVLADRPSILHSGKNLERIIRSTHARGASIHGPVPSPTSGAYCNPLQVAQSDVSIGGRSSALRPRYAPQAPRDRRARESRTGIGERSPDRQPAGFWSARRHFLRESITESI